MQKFTLEASLFDKPTRVDFVAIFAAINWVAFGFGGFGGGFVQVDVFKERAGASLIERIGKLVGADGANYVTDALRAKIGDVIGGDVLFDGIIKWTRHLAWFKF